MLPAVIEVCFDRHEDLLQVFIALQRGRGKLAGSDAILRLRYWKAIWKITSIMCVTSAEMGQN
jgi:hypothetical protein